MQLLVAEVDETGNVEAVWRWEDGMRAPRPVARSEDISKVIGRAEICGTTRDRLMRWHLRNLAAKPKGRGPVAA